MMCKLKFLDSAKLGIGPITHCTLVQRLVIRQIADLVISQFEAKFMMEMRNTAEKAQINGSNVTDDGI